MAKDLLTRYRFSVAKIIPIGPHLVMDLAVGTAIAVSPFVAGCHRELKPRQTGLLVDFGLSAFGIAGITSPKTERGKAVARQVPGAAECVKSLAT